MITKDGENHVVTPPDELVIHTVSGFVEELKNGLEECKVILLNLIEVVEIDSAGFQVLVALKNEALKRGIPLKIIGMSSEADEIISLYGAQSFIDNKR